MRFVDSKAIVFLALLLVGCATTPNAPYRTTASRTNAGDFCLPEIGKLQQYPGDLKGKNIEKTRGYSAYYVEFDDFGWSYNPRAIPDLIGHLEREAKQGDLILFVYVHGWKHNASACDENVACFREVLRLLNGAEQSDSINNHRRPRKIVGIYAGWRGLSTYGSALARNIALARKNTAEHVAEGAMRELFTRLRNFKNVQNEKKILSISNKGITRSPTRLIIVGHSFGGLIVYSTVSPFLLESAVRDKRVKSFGDLVVLINPAFEGSRYESLFQVAMSRLYLADQKPVLVMLNSEHDLATKEAFPLARGLTSIFHSSRQDDPKIAAIQRETYLNTVGHLDRYRTHYLVFQGSRKDEAIESTNLHSGCACASLAGVLAETPQQLKQEEWELAGSYKGPGWSRGFTGGAVLQHVQYNPYNPFWVVSVDKRIIPNHNDIFSPIFMRFLRQLFTDTVR